jgi:hypothetical protein
MEILALNGAAMAHHGPDSVPLLVLALHPEIPEEPILATLLEYNRELFEP